jgi:hypothetical protein
MFFIFNFYILYLVSYFNLVLYVNKNICLFGYYFAIYIEVVVFPDPAQEFTDIFEYYILSIIYYYSLEFCIYIKYVIYTIF